MIPTLRVSPEDEDLAAVASWHPTGQYWYVGPQKLVQLIADRIQPDRAKKVPLRDNDQSNLVRENLILQPSMQTLVLLSLDDEDLRPLLTKVGGRYAAITVHGQSVPLHRIIAKRMGLDLSEHIDHINGNELDNRRENLRSATNAENLMNQKLCSNNTSGFKGVIWRKDRNKWQAKIMVHGKTQHLGYSNCKIEAAKAYDNAARELFGEFARLNFPV